MLIETIHLQAQHILFMRHIEATSLTFSSFDELGESAMTLARVASSPYSVA